MSDEAFRRLLERQQKILDAVEVGGVVAAMQHKAEIQEGAKLVITESLRRLGDSANG